MWIGWVLVLYTGHLSHAFSALVSFGSDYLNESLPQRANLQFASSSHGRRTRVQIGKLEVVISLLLLFWLNLENLEFHMPQRANSQFGSNLHGRRTRVKVGQLSSLCWCCSDWMLRISTSPQNNVVSYCLIPNINAWPFIDSWFSHLHTR